MLFYYKYMYKNSRLASISDCDKEDNSYHKRMVHILCSTKIYSFENGQMCFLRQEGDNEFYQCLIHDTLHSEFVFNLHKYPEDAMRKAIVTAWARFLAIKELLYSSNQNPWVPGQGMTAELQRKQDKLNCS